MTWKIILLIISYAMATMANTCPTTYASACGTPLQVGLNSTDEDVILDIHNELRSYVAQGEETRGNPGSQPSATNMRTMTWNDELATLAQSWANQCNFSHYSCGGSSSFTVGQNIYAVIANSLLSLNMTQPVLSWYNEVKYFNKSSISPFVYLEKASHYTQVVWANSYYLGCGYIAYTNSTTSKVWHYFVCNYGPAGNYVGGTMYKSGDTCSACATGYTCNETYTGLCG